MSRYFGSAQGGVTLFPAFAAPLTLVSRYSLDSDATLTSGNGPNGSAVASPDFTMGSLTQGDFRRR